MFKKILFFCMLLMVAGDSFADDINTTIEINGVNVDGGLVYVAVYSNETDYKAEKAYISFIMEPVSMNLTYLCELPEGDYVVSAFQDKNNDGELNTTIFGIPTEHIGITNYSLRGIPSSFQKLKTAVNANSTRLIVNMGRVKPLGFI